LTLHFRTLAGDDPARYLSYDAASIRDVKDRFVRYLDAGNFRSEWLWVAEDDGDVVARAAFWGRPGGDQPLALDHFDMRPGVSDAVDVGAALLSAAYGAITSDPVPDHHLFLPPRWREHPEAGVVHPHLSAAERAGLTPLVERHRLHWTPQLALAEPSDRLRIRAVRDDDAELLVELIQRVNEGSLDVGMTRDVAAHGAEAAARQYLADMIALDPSRAHWLLGYDGDQPVALAIGSLNPQHALVGFVGVAHEHRGHGYALDLLVAVTQQLAATGATEIRADTDYTNAPMVRTFERAGWHTWGTRVVLQGPPRTM
jgi:RimJ/RimL family protein N-acetyltransferase